MSEIKTAEEIIGLINDYWKFDNQQQPMSSWHDKQDLINFLSSQFKEVKLKEGVSKEHKAVISRIIRENVRCINNKLDNVDIASSLILSLSTPSMESDAVDFAEWVENSMYIKGSSPIHWYDFRYGKESGLLTTSELYNLFKQSKTK